MDIGINIDKDNLKNIYIDMVILENIYINIDIIFLENIAINKGILQNIDFDKILYRLEFGISNRASHRVPPVAFIVKVTSILMINSVPMVVEMMMPVDIICLIITVSK